ncbi:uncharacterized protein KIAA1841 homolog [Chelonus insularis]|uniref:uncharacterized protein KIAA1841 homolog n=1 Tax=Chelonus insularis TaxID=460826 RepID=UPI001589A8FB|nr:uncharacterized protein KIAA1841 homolog [Chelonus insularis]
MHRKTMNLSDQEQKYNQNLKFIVNKSTHLNTPLTYGENASCKGQLVSRIFNHNDETLKNKSSQHEENYPQLTIQMFFEFIRTAYQVNDSIEGLSNILAENSEINWSELAKIDLNLRTINNKNVGTHETNEKLDEEVKPSCSSTQSNQQSYSYLQGEEFLESESAKDGEEDTDRDSHIHGSLQLKNIAKKEKSRKFNTVIETKEYPLTNFMKKSLSNILHEGLLDSVLPYMLPKTSISQPIIKKSVMNTETKKIGATNNNIDKLSTAQSLNKEKDRSKIHRKSLETEVEIHVCDEAKNIKKDFRCPQKLLVQKMCYFADVTAGQKLEEMDISVHCDIVIFDWLMRWVKKDMIKKSEWPVLEANNVIPITVSASFLQMEPLLDQCLLFCHKNMSEVLKTSTILTCLNDNIFTRLANLFTNIDVETLKDKKDKIQSRLFCKLILALSDPIPDNKRGHYSSLASLFKCSKCGKNVIRSIADNISCHPSAMKIDHSGNIHSRHIRDLSWSLNDYIINLRSELRGWRKVYWRLWGDCHFLFCRQCNTYFPINQMDWCSFHPEIPQFFANDQQRSASYPLGRYPCCSQRAYRFESLPNNEGCRFKEHIPSILMDSDGYVLNIFSLYRDAISLDPPQIFFPEKITKLVARDPSLPPGKLLCNEPMWWDGIELTPPREKLGLLAKNWGGSSVRKPCQFIEKPKSSRKLRPQSSQAVNTSSPTTSTSDSDEDDGITTYGDSSIDENSDNSEESHRWPAFKSTCKVKRHYNSSSKRNNGIRSWNMNLLVKYNQDNQRDFEEKAMTQMINVLTKKTSIESNAFKTYKSNHVWNNQPLGGTYVKLESEFKEQSANSCKVKNTNYTKGTVRVRSSKLH